MNAALMQQVKRRNEHHEHEGAHGGTYTPLPQREGFSDGGEAEPDHSRLFDSSTLDAVVEMDHKIQATRDWWKKSSGLHSVQTFLKNYPKHPAGWGALLMIHGIPEVTGRLRSKVENFAIYSALFLASAIAALIAPPSSVTSCTGWECELRKRLYFYCLIVGVVSQVLCILLAMAFGNALNEAARDSDVFRMFSPAGQGFLATRKCEIAFQTGVATTCVSMLAAVQSVIGWEPIIFSCLVVPVAGYVYWDTKSKLFSSASIVEFWKSGKAGEEDPYDLEMFVESFRRQQRSMQTFQAIVANGAVSPPDRGHDAISSAPSVPNPHSPRDNSRQCYGDRGCLG
jgi:hypothetical protein